MSSGFPFWSSFRRDQNANIQQTLSHNRYPLHIIGVGTPQGAAIPVSNGEFLRDNSGQMVVSAMDRGNLQSLSASLNGRYSDISINASDLETVLADSLLRGDDDSYLESEEEVELWQDAGPWLLILLLPLCALCFRRGWVLQLTLSAGVVLLALPPTPALAQQDPLEQQSAQQEAQQAQQEAQQALETQPNAPTLINEDDLQEMAIGGPLGEGEGQAETPPAPRQGFDIRSLWLNRDQRGVRALEEGDPYTATSLFEIPEWRGSAAFRAGDYQAAINAFSQGDDLDSIYNLGNALAFAERLEEAIAAYERVLAQDPQHEDALKNKAIVEDLLEEQQQQEQEQQEQQEQEQQEQQESQSESDSDDSEQDQQQEQEEQEQQEQSQDQQQDEQQQESESENADQGQQRSDAQVEQEEDQESLEQFLRRIEDDPGELLQRKFQFESRRRMIERRTSGQNSQ
jgi:Ca-activated chloride channel family protein